MTTAAIHIFCIGLVLERPRLIIGHTEVHLESPVASSRLENSCEIGQPQSQSTLVSTDSQPMRSRRGRHQCEKRKNREKKPNHGEREVGEGLKRMSGLYDF